MLREGTGVRRAGVVSAAAACLLTLVAGLTPAGAAAPSPSPWVGLDGGHVGGYEWSVKVRRPPGPAGAKRPCLLVGASWPLGRLSYGRIKARQCAGDQRRLVADEPPLIASGAQPSQVSDAKMTAVGIVVAPAVRRVDVTYANGAHTTIPLRRISSAKARRARLGPLRYAAFVVHGAWCTERVVTEDAAGHPLWDSGVDAYPCSSAE